MNTRPTTAGMTILEVVIATAIFVTFVAMVMEAQTSNARYVAMGESQDELSSETASVFDAISLDLTASGWCFTDTAADYLTASADRGLHYLPFAQIQDHTGGAMPEALGTTFAYAVRPASDPRSFPVIPAHLIRSMPLTRVVPFQPGSPNDATTRYTDSSRVSLGAASRITWTNSYFARSQELLFTKASVAIWDHVNDKVMMNPSDKPALFFSGLRSEWESVAATPTDEEAKRARLRILYPSGWAPVYDAGNNISGYTAHHIYRYNNSASAATGTMLDPVTEGDASIIPYGVVMESGRLLEPDGDLGKIGVNWRTIDGTAFTDTSQDPTNGNIAEYGYAVIRSPVGLGRLVRTVRTKLSLLPAAAQIVGVEKGQLLPVADPISAGDFRMRIDAVLSDNVVRVVFDTVRTVDADLGNVEFSTLDYNTIRARIWFARVSRANATEIQARVVERVFTMRAQNTANDKDPQVAGSNASILGTQSIGLPY